MLGVRVLTGAGVSARRVVLAAGCWLLICAAPAATADGPDSTPPTVTITAPAVGATYFQNTHVEADFECVDEDGGSGLDTCAGSVEDAILLDTTKLGDFIFEVTATDKAGNVRTREIGFRVVSAPRPPLCAERKPTIIVARGQGFVRGTKGPDVILGSDGRDRISGGAGRDFICGGKGNDRIIGGTSHDSLFGDGGNDTLAGNTGNDRLFGGTGSDRLGTSGTGRGADFMFGGPGNDLIRTAGDYKDNVSCGSGRDHAFADPFDRLDDCELIRLFRRPPPAP